MDLPVLGWPSAHGVERVPPQGAPGACGGHASAGFSPFWRGPAPEPKGTKRANLTQKVDVDLPFDLRLAHVRMQPVCDLDDSSLICQDKSPLHISCTLAPARVCSATKTCHTNQTVGVVQL